MAPQRDDCLFCKLSRGEIPSARVFENDQLIAFLDINPVNKGHVLIVPREHADTLFDVRPELGSVLLEAMQRVGRAVMKATNAEGLNVMQNNFAAAGQQVGHVHWHLIPRHAGDGHSHWAQGRYADDGEMRAVAEAIKKQL